MELTQIIKEMDGDDLDSDLMAGDSLRSSPTPFEGMDMERVQVGGFHSDVMCCLETLLIILIIQL